MQKLLHSLSFFKFHTWNVPPLVVAIIRPQVLHLPTIEKMWLNSREAEEKYHLPGFGAGVDGTFITFEEKPR